MPGMARIGIVALGLTMSAGSAVAHHGWSGYDASKLVTLSGKVQEASFEFPHAMVMLQLESKDGKLWHIVLAPPSRMSARGLPAGSIKAGDEVTVEGYPHRAEPQEFRAERIRVKGQSVELR